VGEVSDRASERLKRFLPVLSIAHVLFPLLVLTLIGTFLWQGWSDLRVDSVGDDASQNLRSALNVLQHGVYGESEAPLQAGFRREPFPNWLLAFHLKWIVRPPADITFREFVADPGLLRRTMGINLIYMLALFLSLWGLCLRVLRPLWMAHAVAALVIYYSYEAFGQSELDTLNTELPAAVLIVGTGLAFVLLRQRLGTGWALTAGAVFGALVLTKASGGYVAVLLIPLVPLFLGASRRRALRLGLCVGLGFGVAVLPWVGRNLIEFGKPVIARGGGTVLLIRSVYDGMNPEEYRGAFYAFAPYKLKKEFFEERLGYSPRQLKCGGSLERLVRNLPCDEELIEKGRFDELRGFYQMGKRGLPHQLQLQAEREGLEVNGEDLLRRAAIERIRAAPVRHLLVSLPLTWRGMWSFRNQRTWFGVLANGLAMASLALMPFLGLLLRQRDWFFMSLVGAGYFYFYGLFSHFINRYSEPLIPLSLVCLCVLLLASLQALAGALLSHRSNKVSFP
jgi:hypothetical protein